MNKSDFENMMDERGVKTQPLDPSCVLSEISKETIGERGQDMKGKVRVKMTETMNGKDDHEVITRTFVKDTEYTIGPSLAHVFIKQLEIATEVKGKAAKVPENKMLKPGENKGGGKAAKKSALKKKAAKKSKAKK